MNFNAIRLSFLFPAFLLTALLAASCSRDTEKKTPESGRTDDGSVTWFSTGGETVYHLRGAVTDKKILRSVITAAYSGKVICFDFSGKKLWEQNAGTFFPFDMDAGDIDGDGLDECAVASSDGSLYLIDNDGSIIKRVFDEGPPLHAVKIISWDEGKTGIFCGGVEKIIYHINPAGQIVNSVQVPASVRSFETGRFSEQQGLTLVAGLWMDYQEGKFSLHSLPDLTMSGTIRSLANKYYYEALTGDFDGDGNDEIAFSGNGMTGRTMAGAIFESDGTRKCMLQTNVPGEGQNVYNMVMLDRLPAGGNTLNIVAAYASSVKIYSGTGEILKDVRLPVSPAGIDYDETTHTLLLGSAQSGGDCVYLADLENPGWESSLSGIGYRGKIKTIVDNIETLKSEIENFTPPPYQKTLNPGIFCVVSVNDRSHQKIQNLYKKEFPYPNISLSGNQWFTEKYDRSKQPFGWDKKRDTRWAYNQTAQEIIETAKEREAKGLPFTWTIGHGNDPFYLQLSTVEGILKTAPNTCIGFIFPEVARDASPAYMYAIKEHIKPICDLCIKYGNKKVFLRSKFIHWTGDCYTEVWNWIFEDKKYKDIIVPAMEETYERLCDLSLSGRVGLWQTGYVTDWAARVVHDNPCYDRLHQWASTMVGSHYLRALAYQAVMGAKYYLIQIGEVNARGEDVKFQGHGLSAVQPFLHMIGKGILIIPRSSEELLSISPLAVGMRTPPEAVMKASHNSHEHTKYAGDPQWVFSRMEGHWAQAPTPEWDFGYYGIGRRSQAMNFIPKFPYGFVSFIPEEAKNVNYPGINKVIVTDGEVWYDSEGNSHSAKEYAPVVEQMLIEAGEKMFLQVRGDVAWSVTRIDNKHVRLVLIDPGYLNPDDRQVTVNVNPEAVSATDILRGEPVRIKNNSFSLTVPMGILRVIDIEHN